MRERENQENQENQENLRVRSLLLAVQLFLWTIALIMEILIFCCFVECLCFLAWRRRKIYFSI